MKSVLCITIRFLDPVPQFHGRGNDGNPEWPPSPLRLFQALVCASANRWRGNLFQEYARPALQWLEALRPSIAAPQVPAESFGYRMYVPNNSGDLMTAAWARGDTETSMAKFRVEKDVRPTHMAARNDEFAAVHYLYPLTDTTEFAKHKQILIDAARSITHLGWGVDMVAGNAAEVSEGEAARLTGECWRPAHDATSAQLRVPRAGTLEKLMEKHQAFLNRLSDEGFKPIPPLTAFATVGYRRDTDSAPRPFAAFELHKPLDDMATQTGGKFRAFDATRRTVVVAGMVRHAVASAAQLAGRPNDWINTYVHGHTADGNDRATGAAADQRFAYLPLPSLEQRGTSGTHVGPVRRVLVVGPPGGDAEVNWVRRALSGQELLEESGSRAAAMLSAIPNADKNLGGYVGASRGWSTVTPVVLPGYDDTEHHRRRPNAPDSGEQRRRLAALDERVLRLLKRAFRQAGFAEQMIAGAEFQWRNVGFWPGVDLATRYTRSDHHRRFSVYHVRVRFANPVRGPLAVGAGRYRGLGVFAVEPE